MFKNRIYGVWGNFLPSQTIGMFRQTEMPRIINPSMPYVISYWTTGTL